ncbi:MAG: hypothetical protein GY810_01765 [Aureispira sp.]|nr:hypothetical protein [Aureispira sp.]
MRLVILLGVFCFISLGLSAQLSELEQVAAHELKGKWVGKLTQESGGIASEYSFEMFITIEENKISGYSTIEVNGLKGKLSLNGTVDGLHLHLQELKLTSKDLAAREASWCIKIMELNFGFKRGKFRLEGPWKGRSNKFKSKCSPGKIYLKKEAIRA